LRTRIAVFILLLWSGVACGQSDALLTTMKQELNRSFEALKKTATPPYFISYQLTDNRAISVQSSFGALTSSSDATTRLLDIDLRVGDYKLDNTHSGGDGFDPRTGYQAPVSIPMEDDAQAVKVALWLETDRHYKSAVQRLEAIRTNAQTRPPKEDRSPDFSTAPPESSLEALAPFSFDQRAWEAKVRKYGRVFRQDPNIFSAHVNASGEIETRRYVNTDGSELRISMPLYRLDISATIKATDGEILPLHRQFMSFTPEGMPGEEAVMQAVSEMVAGLVALRNAPVGDAYTGPAILSGRASAVFFHEVFGHRIEGDRLKGDDDAQTFKKKLNQQILPKFLSVYSDPTLNHYHSADLVGYYSYDDEGVKARRVQVVQNGVFRSFLISRSPMAGFEHSNGHGRRQQGYPTMSRQSNLVVEASQSVSHSALKKLLIERVKAAKKPYGLLFDDIEGGFTFTGRNVPNAFSVMPTVVYRVYPDGREERVRGLNLVGTPLIAFSKISAADDAPDVFNGMCGAESGWVPVSAIAPGLLVDQIEVQRKPKSQDRDPILPAPNLETK
jgi:TldD protein